MASVRTPLDSNLNSNRNPALYGGISLIFSSFLSGTTGNDTGNGIAVDANGLICVIGTAQSSDFPVTANAYHLWRRTEEIARLEYPYWEARGPPVFNGSLSR